MNNYWSQWSHDEINDMHEVMQLFDEQKELDEFEIEEIAIQHGCTCSSGCFSCLDVSY